MDQTELRRTVHQILNYSVLCDHEHHLVIQGLGEFHVNETKVDGELDVDVWLQTMDGKRIWITFENIDVAIGELSRHTA